MRQPRLVFSVNQVSVFRETHHVSHEERWSKCNMMSHRKFKKRNTHTHWRMQEWTVSQYTRVFVIGTWSDKKLKWNTSFCCWPEIKMKSWRPKEKMISWLQIHPKWESKKSILEIYACKCFSFTFIFSSLWQPRKEVLSYTCLSRLWLHSHGMWKTRKA